MAPDDEGIPLLTRYRGATLSVRLQNARIYRTPDGLIVVTPEGDKNS